MSACDGPLVEGYACEGKDTENLGKKKMWRDFCGEKVMEIKEKGGWKVGRIANGGYGRIAQDGSGQPL